MEQSRTSILMGRLDKLGNYQAKLTNLCDGVVFGGQLPEKAREYFTGPEFKAKAMAKIARAEALRLKIALAVYDDL